MEEKVIIRGTLEQLVTAVGERLMELEVKNKCLL